MRLFAPCCLLACAPLEPTREVDAAPQAWGFPAEEPGEPATPELLAARVQEAIDRTFTFTAEPIFAGYQAIVSSQTPMCPAYYRMGEFTYWYDDCISENGARFDGYTFLQPLDNTSVDYTYAGMSMWGAASVTLADGRVFHLGGRIEASVATGQDQIVWVSRVSGTFRWDGTEADATWLGDGYALDLALVATWLNDGSAGQSLVLEGGIDGFDGPLSSVRFEGITAYDSGGTPPAEPCSLEPSGVIAVRDESGRWYEILFDRVGGADAGADPALDAAMCDGCGHVVLDGAPVYELCLDFQAWLEWDATGPW